MRKIILSIFALFSVISAYSQVKFEVHAPLSVTVGERFRIEFTLTNAQGSNFVSPSVTGADLIAGPSVANGSQTTIINGQQSSTTTQTYTFIAVAQGSGSVKVGTASVLANNKSYTSKPLTIEVHGSSSGAQGGNGGSNAGAGGGAATAFSASDALLRMEVSKTDVFKGEAVVATLKLYTRVPIVGVEDVKYAAFNGFWTQELTADGQPVRATLNGKAYTAQVVRQWLVYPQKAGMLEIEQNEFTVVAQFQTQGGGGGGSLFDEFFGDLGGRTEMVKRKLIAPAVKINVKELPKPEPANFSGAVGKFTMESSISANSLPANESGNIKLKITGSGNFPLIMTPEISLPAALEKFEVKMSEEIKYTTSGATGSKTFDYPFITRAEGDYTIDPIEISYFDVASKSYKTLSSGAFNITVTKGTGGGQTAGAFISGVTKEDLKMLGQDIRFIKVGKPEFKSKDDKFLWSIGFFLAFGVIIVMFIVMVFMMQKMISQRADVARVKNKKANKVAIRRLKRSHGYMVANDKDKFYEEMLRALWGYIGDKLTIEVADLTKEHVQRQLEQRGVSAEQATEFLNLISQCEYAQYSPSDDSNMSTLYNKALDIIGNMEVK